MYISERLLNISVETEPRITLYGVKDLWLKELQQLDGSRSKFLGWNGLDLPNARF